MKTKLKPKNAAGTRVKIREPRKRIMLKAQRTTVDGKRVVILDEAEFDRLLVKADEFEPLMPEPNADGTYPALDALRADLALRIIRHRRKAGLTQADLARRAGIRPESLNRIEQGRVDPSIRTLEKIDKALNDVIAE